MVAYRLSVSVGLGKIFRIFGCLLFGNDPVGLFSLSPHMPDVLLIAFREVRDIRVFF
jgi:hypothetical protein